MFADGVACPDRMNAIRRHLHATRLECAREGDGGARGRVLLPIVMALDDVHRPSRRGQHHGRHAGELAGHGDAQRSIGGHQHGVGAGEHCEFLLNFRRKTSGSNKERRGTLPSDRHRLSRARLVGEVDDGIDRNSQVAVRATSATVSARDDHACIGRSERINARSHPSTCTDECDPCLHAETSFLSTR